MKHGGDSPELQQRLARLEAKEKLLDAPPPKVARTPFFCSGCPHNTSTRVPEGSRAHGRHRLPRHGDLDARRGAPRPDQPHGRRRRRPGSARRRSPPTSTSSRIWATAPTTTRGLLAIRAAGGRRRQHHLQDPLQRRGRHDRRPAARRPARRSPRSPARSRPRAPRRSSSSPTSPTSIRSNAGFAPGVTIRHRDELDAVQRELREIPGLTVLIYDQTCAAEKRRRRKRGTFPDPAKRVFINDAVCEGCGDCSDKIELRLGQAARDRARPQAHDRPVATATRTSPASTASARASSRCMAARPPRPGARSSSWSQNDPFAIAADADPAAARRGLRHPGHRHRRHRRHHRRRADRHGGASRGQGLHGARLHRPRAEERRGDEPCPPRAQARGPPRRAHRRRRRRPGAGLRHGGGGRAGRRCRASSTASPRP